MHPARKMLRRLTLVLPALLPSWRFFDVIAPSPRIQYRLFAGTEPLHNWLDANLRPPHIGPGQMLTRLLWNATWNEQLFMTSCAERLLEHYTQYSENELLTRIARRLPAPSLHPPEPSATYLQFRLLLVARHGDTLATDEAFVSRITALSA